MTYLATTIKEFVLGRPKAASADPVYHFFFETSSGDRKKVYDRALKKAQTQQESVTCSAQAKNRA